jgi:hypothetical protein
MTARLLALFERASARQLRRGVGTPLADEASALRRRVYRRLLLSYTAGGIQPEARPMA